MTTKIVGRNLFLANGFASLSDAPEMFRTIDTQLLFAASARTLSSRYGVTERTVVRWRALVRKAKKEQRGAAQ